MIPPLLALIRDVYRVFSWRVPLLFALAVINAVFEGLTLTMLLPLLGALGFGGGAQDIVTRSVAALFATFAVPVTTGSVGLTMIALFGISATFFLLEAYLAAQLQAAYVAHWQKRLFDALADSAWRFLQRRRAGDTVSALTLEATRLGNAFYQANLIVSSLVFLVAQATIAAIIAPAIVAAMGTLTVVLFAATRYLMRRAIRYGGELTRANADMQSVTGELVGAMKFIKATAQEIEAKHLVERVVDRIESYTYKNLLDVQIVRAIFNYGSGATVVALLIGGPLFLGVEVGAIIIVVAMFVRLFPKVTALRQCMQAFGFAAPGYERLRAMAKEAERACEFTTGTVPPPAARPAAISFRRVTVRGDHDTDILRSVDLEIPAGSFVMIVGPTAAGKTTLVDCALGLVMPQNGEILVDGISTRSLSLPAWRHSVGYLGQDPVVFAGSVRENVCWGRSSIGDTDISEALEAADAAFALRLPRGLDTPIGERGGALSGGERQRLALARALVGRPRLLILDEVTSALDVETERRIANAVSRRRGETTVLAITHRLSTVTAADLIVLLEAGRVVEQGSLPDLLGRPGRFTELWRMQSRDLSPTAAPGYMPA